MRYLKSDELKIEKEGKTVVTERLQEFLDKAKAENKTAFLNKGIYLTGPLFLDSGMTLEFEEGSELRLVQDESLFKKIPTRIAGIFIDGYPALLNAIDKENIVIRGKGILNGQGEPWYKKYWGEDGKGGMRKTYDEKGLRWACDYDCLRPRNLLLQNCKNIRVMDVILKDSPFWNLHVLLSSKILIKGVNVISDNPFSPSTDGIDIDSSEDVEIRNCTISTDDDCISLKSGRDQEGLRFRHPTKRVKIMNCTFYKGYGISLGSELSGGISDVEGKNLSFKGTSCAFRIKSSLTRKGYVRNVHLANLMMEDVTYPFYCYLNWNPLYNKVSLPENYQGEVPSYYRKLLSFPDKEIPNTEVRGLFVNNAEIGYSKDYQGESCLFTFRGFNDNPLSSLHFKNIRANIGEYGSFVNSEPPEIVSSEIVTSGKSHTIPGSFDNR